MKEVGIDISSRQPKQLDRVSMEDIDIVINLSDDKVHLVSDHLKLESWPMPDPSAAAGDEQDILGEFRRVRDELRARIEALGRASRTGSQVTVDVAGGAVAPH